jgi:hypothetical protein
VPDYLERCKISTVRYLFYFTLLQIFMKLEMYLNGNKTYYKIKLSLGTVN